MQVAKKSITRLRNRTNGSGVATVYRMINALEEIGAISRQNLYKIECGEGCRNDGGCEIILEDDTICRLSKEKLDQIIREGIRQYGYLSTGKKVSKIIYHCR